MLSREVLWILFLMPESLLVHQVPSVALNKAYPAMLSHKASLPMVVVVKIPVSRMAVVACCGCGVGSRATHLSTGTGFFWAVADCCRVVGMLALTMAGAARGALLPLLVAAQVLSRAALPESNC